MRIKLAFTAGLVLAALASSVPGCSDGTSSSPDHTQSGAGGESEGGAGGTHSDAGGGAGGASDGLGLFEAWELARSAVRKSPDHLPARAEALVANGEPSALFEFVRDQIATYPPASNGFTGALTVTRWGTRATLRGGAGTPREKAELLVALYKQAGLTAEVVQGAPDPAKLDGHAVLLRTTQHDFESKLSRDEEAAIQAALGSAGATPPAAIDPDGERAVELADSLLPLLPSDLGSNFDFTLPAIPLVRVKIGGVWKYANPIAPSAEFGDSATLATPTTTSAASNPQKVHVLLEGARADAPYERFKLVEQTYDAADVAGRRIQVAFSPPVELEKLVGMRVQDVETLAPVLSVVAPDLSDADKQRLAVVGDVFTLGGDQYQRTATGLTVNGAPLAAGITDPRTIAKVSSVAARAPGTTYPRINVTVSALDAKGANVAGLGAGAFEVLEDGQPVSFSVTQNQAPPPRVVLLFDASSSIPAEFHGASAVAMGNQIVDALYAAYADAQLRVGYVDFGAIFESTTWATTAAAAKTQVQGLQTASGSSELWQALYDAERLRPTVIILVTDGAATDKGEPQYRSALATGAPVLSIGVGTVETPTLDAISAASGGTNVTASRQQEAIDAALAEINARSAEDYVISYQAPPSDGKTHTVTVTVNGVSSEVTYEVPATPAIPNALSGLYLTLGVNGRNESLPVAGFSLGFSSAFPAISEEMLDDVRSLLFGRISISVEGAAPSAGVVLDDWLSDKLALRPYWEAVAAADPDAILAALSDGINVAPSKLAFSQAPLRDAASTEALTFETGPRVSALLQKLRPAGPVSRELNLFPLSQWATAADDPRAAWEQTLKATAGLAVLESQLFTHSTLESLTGATLSSVDAGHARDQAGLSSEERLAWGSLEAPFNGEYQLLVSQKPGAFWAVHEGTGTLLGVLPNGTGGGAEDVCANYAMTNAYLQYLGLLGSLFGVSLGGWAELAKWEAENVTMATLVIGYGAMAQDLAQSAQRSACNLAQDAAGGNVPVYAGVSAVLGTISTVSPSTSVPSICGMSSVCQ